MSGLRLYKKEKLCSQTAIDRLFAPPRKGDSSSKNPIGSAMAYPWRAVWSDTTRTAPTCSRFLISVPKKRLRHAVDRVTMRRRMREAYRLGRDLLPKEKHLDIIFIYVANGLTDYASCQKSLKKILNKVSATPIQPQP